MPTDRPTLLLVAPFPPTQGPEADKAYYLCRTLAEHGWRVKVATTRGSVTCDHPRATVHADVRDWSWSDAGTLATLLDRVAPDVVLLFAIDWLYHYQPMVTFFPTFVRVACPHARVVTVFDDSFVARPWDQASAVRLGRHRSKRWAGLIDADDRYGTLLRDSDSVIVVSERVGARLAPYEAGLERKMVVVPTPPILRMAPADGARERRRERLGVKPGDVLLAYFGYLSQGKGVETLLRAFAQLCGRRDDLRLVLIGGTIPEPEHVRYAEEVRRLPEQLGVAGKVFWTGAYAWDSEEPSRLLRAADMAVLPYDAGVCLHNCSLAGAAAHGLPIVTTRGPDLEDAFVDRANVLLCPPEDAEALAGGIETVVNDAGLRERLRIGALTLAGEWFNWDKALPRMGLDVAGSASDRKRSRTHGSHGTERT